MVFLDYETVSISGSGNGTSVVYTLPYTAYIAVEVQTADFDNIGIELYTFINQAGTNDDWEKHLLLTTTSLGIDGVRKYSGVYRAGQSFTLRHPSTTTGIILHVFRIPESP